MAIAIFLQLTRAIGVLCLAACAAQPRTTSPDGLAGTTWQLVRISMGDGSTITPEDRSKYTIAFGADGRASIRADCNRGSGGWRSEAASHLEFGAIATTKVMCPPGSLHNRFLSNLGYVRSYVLRDGRLHLSMYADAGILELEPIP